MLRRFIIPLLIVAAGFGAMKFLTSFKKEQRRVPPRPFIRTVTTQHIQYGTITPAIESMGRVLPLERVQLTPEVSGLVLDADFKLYKGNTFRKGAILLKIDTVQAFLSYSSTISDLQNALAGLLPELKTDLPDALAPWQTFFSRLSVDHLPALPEVKTDREKLLATRYQVYKLYFLARRQQNTLEKHTIRAPFTGTVDETTVYPSSMARTGMTVATVVRTDAIEIELALTQKQLPFVRQGIPVRVSIEGIDSLLNGSIHRISNILDAGMQTAPVFVRISGGSGIAVKTGAYAKVTMAGSELAHAVALPRKALHNKNFVYTIESDTLAENQVTIAFQSIDTAYCTGGIPDGAELINEPLQDAVTGMAVQNATTALKRQQQMQSATGKKTRRTPDGVSASEARLKKTLKSTTPPDTARPAAGKQ